MNACWIFRASLLPVALGAALSARAATLDFEELVPTDTNSFEVFGPTITTQGFRLETDGSGFFAPLPNSNYLYTGSRALYVTAGRRVTLTRADGGLFDISSIDFWNAFENQSSPGATISFDFVYENGSTFGANYTFSGGNAVQRIDISGNTTLRSLTFDQESPFVQFDNIVASPVPEPASLVALSMGALATVRRRKASGAMSAIRPARRG